MNVQQVLTLARGEPAVERGKAFYFGRPWSEVLDAMENAEVRTVGELETPRIETLHKAVEACSEARSPGAVRVSDQPVGDG